MLHARLALALILALLMGQAAAPTQAPAREANPDPGIRLEIDRNAFRVVAIDLASGEYGPSVRVAVGSPAHETPSGQYRLWQVIHDPAWSPGPTARELGAGPIAPSAEGPLGVAKIPFSGSYALHGGANRFSVGKPVTLGCLRGLDGEVARLLDWFESRSALGEIRQAENGERPQPFVRPIRLVIR